MAQVHREIIPRPDESNIIITTKARVFLFWEKSVHSQTCTLQSRSHAAHFCVRVLGLMVAFAAVLYVPCWKFVQFSCSCNTGPCTYRVIQSSIYSDNIMAVGYINNAAKEVE